MSISSKKLIAATAFIAAAFVLIVWRWNSEIPLDQLIAQAKLAIERQDASKASLLAAQILKQDPENSEGLRLSAVIAAETGLFSEAVEFCQRVPKVPEKTFADSRVMAGNICVEQLGSVTRAELLFRELLSEQPDHLAANDRMVYLLGLQSRILELIPFHLRVLRESPGAAIKVQLLMQGELAYPDQELTQQLRRSNPECAGLILAEAHLAYLEKNFAEAERLCRLAVTSQPDLAEAQARLGLILLQQSDLSKLYEWRCVLPDSVKGHPGVLYGAGRIAMLEKRPEEAVRCFWESLRVDPNQVGANYHLGQSLIAVGRSEDADVFLKRASLLEKYQKQLETTKPGVQPGAGSEEFDQFLVRAKESMEMAQSLGLVWETYSWVVIAAQAPRPPEWAREQLRTMQKTLDQLPLLRTPPEQNPAEKIDLGQFPMPDFSRPPIVQAETSMTSSESPSNAVSFQEIAEEHGLRFVFDNGFPKPREAQIRGYDFTGGGVGVIDADSDGWPDLCFPQGCSLVDPAAQASLPNQDSLFRNVRGKSFTDVTARAFPDAVDYSQGVSVGDHNSDGFPDVLIANLGSNRLLKNNGDGTFTQDVEALKEDSKVWTTSCLICDLNNDGHPDFYFVNYLSGDVLTRICSDEERHYGNCAPQSFPAEQDQLLLSLGDGTFQDATDSSGIRVENGKGLGIVAADFNDDRRIDLFVANDGVPNFYFENQSVSASNGVELVEQAMARGLGVNGAGQSEACMGIAADDLDLDGQLDLFVTNFYEETNTVYRAVSSAAVFEDVTARTTLGSASLRFLGFGTQAIDGELDGRPDLVVLNGHVDSYPGREVPYRMVPQYFANSGDWKFTEVPAETLSPYFARPQLGRALATLDWNRDGAEDLAATHLDESACLLSNTTTQRGHFIKLRLAARDSARDAASAVVTVKTSTTTRTRQLTSGNGYQASNERCLVFGLGPEVSIESVSVTWPSGKKEVFSGLTIDREYLLVEGRSTGLMLPL